MHYFDDSSKNIFCLFQLDRLPKAEVGTDEEKTKLVSQDSKESDVWKKNINMLYIWQTPEISNYILGVSLSTYVKGSGIQNGIHKKL